MAQSHAGKLSAFSRLAFLRTGPVSNSGRYSHEGEISSVPGQPDLRSGFGSAGLTRPSSPCFLTDRSLFAHASVPPCARWCISWARRGWTALPMTFISLAQV